MSSRRPLPLLPGVCVVNVVDTVTAAAVVIEQAIAPTAYGSCPDCEIHERSGFAFHSSNSSTALRGCSQSLA